jgi:hypothetical protein
LSCWLAGWSTSKDRQIGEFRHSPGAAVQPGAENHQLGAAVGAYGVVDGSGTGHDHFGVGPYRLVVDALPPLPGYDTVAYRLDQLTLLGTQQRRGRRIGEAARSDQTVCGSPTWQTSTAVRLA